MLIASTTSLARHKVVWSTNHHNVLLCREILVVEPYRFKAGTRERGQAWDKVASALNLVEGLRFVVDQRGVRERHAKLERNFTRKMVAEERASGISPDKTELDEAIESIMERREGAEEEIAQRAESTAVVMEKERETAESVRKRSMERLAETRERENQRNAKKKRNSGEETLDFMKDKWRIELELRREELEVRKKEHHAKERKADQEMELRKREPELKEREQQAKERKDEKLLEILTQQQHQQQVILLQIQQGNQALLSLVNSLKEKLNEQTITLYFLSISIHCLGSNN